MLITRNSRAVRTALLASAAGLSITFANTALAQSVERPASDYAERVSQSISNIDAGNVERDEQILIAAPGTPVTARDPNNLTGVGQMIIDQQDGFIGLCTGTLINARTVIFAAHCVNDRAASAYGENSGGQPIGFGFGNNNNAAGASAFGGWLNGINGGARYQTNTGRAMYDANYVAYHPGSLEPDAESFLHGDIAIASLDTPAKGIPTWALLFSQLPTPATIDPAGGTGYHVVIDGYGNIGTGITGAQQSDYRRRIAENTLGALASLDDFEGFIFGGAPGLPQNLYWLDFDDPRRSTAGATPSPYDFNAFRDVAQPNEGITSSGDSGGPLILDRQYARQVVLGVLSGGYTRFYGAQPANGYGTASFYQPLYLYWDWIAANNPYHYATAKAGNGAWTDPTHWVSTQDPNYTILNANGQLVTGVPTSPGTGNTDTAGFGEICFQTPTIADCLDVATGIETVEARPVLTSGTEGSDSSATVSAGTLANNAATASAASLSGQATAQAAGVSATALPAATLANGLPGATDFVPNNFDGNRLLGQAPRYFDITLSATGTTTLNSAVTIDRFTVAGVGAALDIQSAGHLTSLMDITQAAGSIQVNGRLTTPGDYLLMTGSLSGNGTVSAAYFTSMAGIIAPGTASTIGTLNFRGNIILASGTVYMLNLGANGISDRIAVSATSFSPLGAPLDGQANLGGQLAISFDGPTMRAGNVYTILTSEGALTGEFAAPAPLSAILTPTILYNRTAPTKTVQIRITAGSYASVVASGSRVQRGYAQLLDQNRSLQAQFDGIYGPLDIQNAATIRATLEGLAPTTETTVRSLGTASVDNLSGLVRDRLASLDPIATGGTFARMGSPVEVASVNLGLNGGMFPNQIRSDTPQVTVEQGKLPENMSAFVAGGYMEGDSAPMSNSIAIGRENFDGWYVAGGVETLIGDKGAIGFALSYTHLDGEGSVPAHSATGDLYAGTLYGKLLSGGFTLDAQFTAGMFDARTRRTVNFITTPYTLRSDDQALALVGEIGAGYNFDLGAVEVTPRVAARGTQIGFTPTIETGGPLALAYAREKLESAQGRASLTIKGKSATFRPFVTGTFAHDFAKRPEVVGANFVGGIGAPAVFDLNSLDRDWLEASGGITVSTGPVDLSIAGDIMFLRDDVSSKSIRGSLSFRF